MTHLTGMGWATIKNERLLTLAKPAFHVLLARSGFGSWIWALSTKPWIRYRARLLPFGRIRFTCFLTFSVTPVHGQADRSPILYAATATSRSFATSCSFNSALCLKSSL